MTEIVSSLDELAGSTKNGSEYASRYADCLAMLMQKLNTGALESTVRLLINAQQDRKTIFCLGNGGSAATASHFVTDLAWGRRMGGETRPKAISLTSNVPLITALSNDVGYADVFVEQLRGVFSAGDIVFAISASGNSENVLRAIQYANEQGGFSIGLVGFDGGKMKSLCTTSVHVETPPGMYEMVEDVHHSICHIISSYMKLSTVCNPDS